ncbi:HAMP domain-containing sensor histidine kinase [Rhizobium sp. SG570]|uniref:sensor histidine kinase n=1 Tax=Rhizobium sp. SG570 TaxID=2587113 RepID=UPI001447FEF8|nr:HAMP domain-containing sensor histidine kinase [Rhizobium sp. SG570]NKJ39180.1 signal transduction histidine kinase [Rhizobium sp. SG570]
MVDRSVRPPTLIRIITLRIALFAALAMAIQAALVFADYYFDNKQLATLMIERETAELSKGFERRHDEAPYKLPHDLHRYGIRGGFYITRIRTPSGQILYTNCDARCDNHLLPQEVNPPDLWSRMLSDGKPLAVAGGKTYEIHGDKIFVEIAILHDSDGIMWAVIGREFADHLATPMAIMLFFVLGGTLLSIRQALRPVAKAAQEAGHLDPLDPSHLINQTSMPREIADLAAAVNRSLARIGALMKSQRLFTTAVAHEIRTPLAMMKLELGNIEHPRARKIEADLDALADFVGQITALGRLESADRAVFQQVDLAKLADWVVADIAPLVYDRDHTIAYSNLGAGSIEGHAPLLADALRNLVENATKHTPDGTTIEVVAGPGPRLTVKDDAGIFDAPAEPPFGDLKADHMGIGLEIVRRITALHGGRMEIEVDPGRCTATTLLFDQPKS